MWSRPCLKIRTIRYVDNFAVFEVILREEKYSWEQNTCLNKTNKLKIITLTEKLDSVSSKKQYYNEYSTI